MSTPLSSPNFKAIAITPQGGCVSWRWWRTALLLLAMSPSIIGLAAVQAGAVHAGAVQAGAGHAGAGQKPIAFNMVQFEQHQMHYAFAGDVTKPGILFIHGTPGGWSAFARYLNNSALAQDFFLVSVDRLGWGKSRLNGSSVQGDFARQAGAIKAVMAQYPNKPWILVGHSLGASLAPQIALDKTLQVAGLLLLAGSLKPNLGRPRWYNWAANTWVVSKLIGQNMRNSNREIMPLRQELQRLNERISQGKSSSHLVVMQGLQDKLVSPKNADFAGSQWTAYYQSVDVISLADEGHFLPWRQTPLIIETLRNLARKSGL